jgi:predicted transcriptional regulator
MRSITARLENAKAVLAVLKRQATNRTMLEQAVVRNGYGTHATFEGIFKWLCNDGYIVKSERRHRSPYVITEAGEKLYEALP